MAGLWPNGTYNIPRVSSEFGPRKSPGGIGSTNHLGIDLTGIGAIRSAEAGTVIFSGYNGGSGNEVRVRGDSGREFRYKHNSVLRVRVGARVAAGQHIADEGATGAVTGKHSHFEVLVGGRQVNPRTQMGAPASAPAGGGGGAGFNQDVYNRQVFLNARLGVGLALDGRMGPKTKAAIAAFQRQVGLVPDGVWGPKTAAAHAKVVTPVAPAAPAPGPAPASNLSNGGRPTIARGSKGPLVGHLQRILSEKYPAYARLKIDNDFGPAVQAAVKEFQRRAGLVADGVVGPRTWNALGQ